MARKTLHREGIGWNGGRVAWWSGRQVNFYLIVMRNRKEWTEYIDMHENF